MLEDCQLYIEDCSILKSETYPQLFLEAVQKNGSKIAVEFGYTQLTYSQLLQQSLQVASILADQSTDSNLGRVLVFMKRSVSLHAAILGILQSGGTYVPVDSEIPMDRVKTIFEECQAQFILMDAETFQKNSNAIPKEKIIVLPPNLSDSILDSSAHFKLAPPSAHSEAYIIFTSGSTGKPKGIAVSHGSLCHFLRAENSILGIQAKDRVWQGFSVAFDMWIEETLMAYMVGATLVIANQEDVRAVDRLSQKLCDCEISVLHIVPTLAGTISAEVPTLRLVNFGGEACPPSVVNKWQAAGRRLFNTYGPTETTVSATMTELFAGQPVTIGKPLPNYTVYVVDEQLNPLKAGERGELLIGGPGVSMGYVNRADLNPLKFIAKPRQLFVANELALKDPVLYRTGDLVSVNFSGEIEFHGRIDTQVKIRGFRIELEEVESAVANISGVSSVAVKVEQDEAGIDHLVAFYTCQIDSQNVTSQSLRKVLREKLPSYMVPSELVALEAMPTLTSGKIDRKALPPGLQKRTPLNLIDLPAPELSETLSKTEKITTYSLSKIFGGHIAGLDEDFFNDLGGHSLLAAAFVSDLRKYPKGENLSITDVYKYRTVRALSNMMDESFKVSTETEHETNHEVIHSPTAAARLRMAVGQFFGLFLVFGYMAVQFFTPFLAFSYFYEGSESLAQTAVASIFSVVAAFLVLMSLAVTFKWLLLGKVKEGNYPLFGSFHFRWWLSRRIKEALPLWLLSGTPFYGFLLKLFGAKIGKACDLGQLSVDCEDLLEVGDFASISSHVAIDNAVIENGWLKLRKVQVGRGAFVGTSAVLSGGSSLGDWTELSDLSAFNEGQTAKAFEIWKGSPAEKTGSSEAALIEFEERIASSKAEKKLGARVIPLIVTSLQGLAILILAGLAAVPLMPVISLMYLVSERFELSNSVSLLLSPLYAGLYIFSFLVVTWVLRWAVLAKLPAGIYSVNSLAYFRKWFVDQVSQITLNALHPIFATLYLPFWFRALGVKIGKRSEISTASSLTYHLVEIADESFVADRVILGDPVIRNGIIELKETRVGRRSFVGNSAILSDGTNWPDGCLLGVLSVSPESHHKVRENSTWLGVPSSELPRREFMQDVNPELTYQPKLRQYLERIAVETFRILLPSSTLFLLAALFYSHQEQLLDGPSLLTKALLLPVLFLIMIAVPAFLVVVAFKWLAVGKYKTTRWPMWTRQVWWSEAVTAVYEGLAVPHLLEPLRGTPFLAFCLRLMGVKIGKNVLLDTTDFTEFDLVEIGEGANLEFGSGAQTHLFEDRVMKVGPVKIGNRCSVNTYSVVLYDAELEQDVKIGTNSLIMKGERLPALTSWQGVPARSQRRLIQKRRDVVQGREADPIQAVRVK